MHSRWEASPRTHTPISSQAAGKPTMRRPDGLRARKMDQICLTLLVQPEWRGVCVGSSAGVLECGHTPSQVRAADPVRGSLGCAGARTTPFSPPALPGVTTFDAAPDKGNLNSSRKNKGIRLLSRPPLTPPSSLLPFPRDSLESFAKAPSLWVHFHPEQRREEEWGGGGGGGRRSVCPLNAGFQRGALFCAFPGSPVEWL